MALDAVLEALTDEQLAEIKKYVINPVEAREASLDKKATLKMEYPPLWRCWTASTSWTKRA